MCQPFVYQVRLLELGSNALKPGIHGVRGQMWHCQSPQPSRQDSSASSPYTPDIKRDAYTQTGTQTHTHTL